DHHDHRINGPPRRRRRRRRARRHPLRRGGDSAEPERCPEDGPAAAAAEDGAPAASPGGQGPHRLGAVAGDGGLAAGPADVPGLVALRRGGCGAGPRRRRRRDGPVQRRVRARTRARRGREERRRRRLRLLPPRRCRRCVGRRRRRVLDLEFLDSRGFAAAAVDTCTLPPLCSRFFPHSLFV
ncbi:Os10g0377150, partial [Oryza sativa Japonica Group]